MRGFWGFGFGGDKVRAGISRTGRLWAGGRVKGPAGLYAGVIGSSGNGHAAAPVEPAERSSVRFEVDDDGRVFVNEGELELEALREVVRLADERRRKGKPA